MAADKIGQTASLVAQVVMDAYMQAKASKDDQKLLELEQWELNSWPKVALKLPPTS